MPPKVLLTWGFGACLLKMDPKQAALHSLSFHSGLQHPCFTYYSLYGEFLLFVAEISHLSIQSDKIGDQGRPSTARVFKFPSRCFFKCQIYNSPEFLVTHLSHPSPQYLQNICGKTKQKPMLTNCEFPLLDKYSLPLAEG